MTKSQKAVSPAAPGPGNRSEALPAEWIELARGLRAVHELRKQATPAGLITVLADQNIVAGCRNAAPVADILRLAGSTDLAATIRRAHELNPEAAITFIAARLLDEQGNVVINP